MPSLFLQGVDLCQNFRHHFLGEPGLLGLRHGKDGFQGHSACQCQHGILRILAESEFNRFYIRALARRAIEDGIPHLIVYRAKLVRNPRPESEALVETTLPAEALLADLRAHAQQPPTLGVQPDPQLAQLTQQLI